MADQSEAAAVLAWGAAFADGCVRIERAFTAVVEAETWQARRELCARLGTEAEGVRQRFITRPRILARVHRAVGELLPVYTLETSALMAAIDANDPELVAAALYRMVTNARRLQRRALAEMERLTHGAGRRRRR